eukprot:3270000-Amphidinium_carterae.1
MPWDGAKSIRAASGSAAQGVCERKNSLIIMSRTVFLRKMSVVGPCRMMRNFQVWLSSQCSYMSYNSCRYCSSHTKDPKSG